MGSKNKWTEFTRALVGCKEEVGVLHNTLQGEWIMPKEWIEADDGENINSEAIVSYSYELTDKPQELTDADIWGIVLTLVTPDGTTHEVSDLDEIMTFAKSGSSQDSMVNPRHVKPGTFLYYVKNAWEYQEAVKIASNLNG